MNKSEVRGMISQTGSLRWRWFLAVVGGSLKRIIKRHSLNTEITSMATQPTTGQLIEVRITIESRNDYEYLVFEDFKPAGCEPVELKSGGIFEHGNWINRELRDEKVVNFLYSLP